MSSAYTPTIDLLRQANHEGFATSLTFSEDDPPSPDVLLDLCHDLAMLREERKKVQDTERHLEMVIATYAGAKQLIGPGIRVEIRKGADRKEWDSEGLGKAVVESVLHVVDESTGELTDSGLDADTAFRVRDALLGALGISYWRVGALGDLGIDVDDYCTISGYRRSVQVFITPPDDEEAA